MTNLISIESIESIFWYLGYPKYKEYEYEYQECQKYKEIYFMVLQVCPYILKDIDWDCISGCQELSEEFITKFQDKVNWIEISRRQ